MSDAKQVLQKLGDELGHITLIADWVAREKAALENGTFNPAPVLTGAGALSPPEGAPTPAAEAPAEVPAEGNGASASSSEGSAQPPAAPASGASEAPAAGEADGGTAQTATSAPSSEAPAAAPESAPPAEGNAPNTVAG